MPMAVLYADRPLAGSKEPIPIEMLAEAVRAAREQRSFRFPRTHANRINETAARYGHNKRVPPARAINRRGVSGHGQYAHAPLNRRATAARSVERGFVKGTNDQSSPGVLVDRRSPSATRQDGKLSLIVAPLRRSFTYDRGKKIGKSPVTAVALEKFRKQALKIKSLFTGAIAISKIRGSWWPAPRENLTYQQFGGRSGAKLRLRLRLRIAINTRSEAPELPSSAARALRIG